MVAFNFKPEFSDLILDGTKRSTIRSTKRCKVGATMQLYTGKRTKQCRKLMDATCIGTAQITITEDCPWSLLQISGEPIVADRLHEQEGFINAASMVDFFRQQHGLPYIGWLHTWEYL